MPGLDAPPPLPPPGGGPGAPSYSAAVPDGQQAPQVGAGAGMSQTGNQAIRMGMEIDAAIKMLAQMVPQLGPWAEQVTSQLRSQLGQALTSGADSMTDPEPRDNRQFPGGLGNL